MDTTANAKQPVQPSTTTSAGVNVTKLTPLDLNNIRLDVHHTILTPTYLEDLIKKG